MRVIRRTLFATLAITLVSVSLFFATRTPVFATEAAAKTIRQLLAYHALIKCTEGNTFKRDIEAARASDPGWYVKNDNIFFDVSIGKALGFGKPADSSGGVVNNGPRTNIGCAEVMHHVHSALGEGKSMAEFMTSLGYYKTDRGMKGDGDITKTVRAAAEARWGGKWGSSINDISLENLASASFLKPEEKYWVALRYTNTYCQPYSGNADFGDTSKASQISFIEGGKLVTKTMEAKDSSPTNTKPCPSADAMNSSAKAIATSHEKATANAKKNAAVAALSPKVCANLRQFGNDEVRACEEKIRKAWDQCYSQQLDGDLGVYVPRRNPPEAGELRDCLNKSLGIDLSEEEVRSATTASESASSALPSFTDPTSSTESGNPEQPSCVIEGVGWFVCPVVQFLADMSDNVYGFLSDNFLRVSPELVSTSGGTHQGWSAMLGIANSLFVIVFIIIIYSQITGAGISNYGIKKMLPMLIIAAILVNVSYFVCQLAVDLSNIIGNSLFGMFKGWANGLPTTTYTPSNGFATGNVFGNIAILVLAGVGGYLALSALIGGVLAAIVALLSIFFLLILRKALVVLLVVVAPLAFVALILPNTQSLFGKWRKMFVGMLLVYPIVGLLFGAGSLIGNILKNSSGGDTVLQVVAALASVLPLFLVWPTLKKAMESAGMVAGMVSGVSRNLSGMASKAGRSAVDGSAFGKFREFRKAKASDRRSRIRAGTYRGAGGKLNYRNWMSGMNRGLNRSDAFNKVTGGYGAMRDLDAQKQNRSDMDETVAMFGNDDTLASAWAQSGGDISQIDRLGLNDAQKAQFKKMTNAGLHRKEMSHIAAAQFLSQMGKGSSSQVIEALNHAKAAGADDVAIENSWQAAMANYRKSGRGDALGEMQAHMAKNNGAAPIGTGAQKENNANVLQAARQKAWSEVGASSVHRDALGTDASGNPSASLKSYVSHLNANKDNMTAALDGYDDMEARAQEKARSHILAAASARASMESGQNVTFTSVEDAKKHFLAP